VSANDLPVVTVEGRLTADPALSYTQSGIAMSKFTLVSNSRKRQDDGTWVDDKTCFLRCIVWRKPAENVAESLVKGDTAVITGRLITEEWEKDGVKQSMIVCHVENIGAGLRFRQLRHGEANSTPGGNPDRPAERSTAPQADVWSTGQPTSQVPAGSDEPPF
jgi:single-strand DNA-binding protein